MTSYLLRLAVTGVAIAIFAGVVLTAFAGFLAPALEQLRAIVP